MYALILQKKEDPYIYKDFRKLEIEYEQKRTQISLYFDAAKNGHLLYVSPPLYLTFQ